MPKKISPATELRNARRALSMEVQANAALRRERDRFRIRATQAEQDAAEWRRRFDTLLSKMGLQDLAKCPPSA